MKKILFLISMLLFPLNTLAYSDYIYLGGKTLGIEVQCDGVMIVGFYQINGEYNKGNPKLKVGDYIISVNDNNVNTLNDITKEIEKYTNDGRVKVSYKRDGKENDTILNLINDNGVYKTGLYVKDSITGIGTLTYVDPSSLIYGALGHEIIESNSSKIVEIKDGSIFKSSIISIDKSLVGHAGSKNAKYFYNTIYGNILKNTNHGIFGKYNYDIENMKLVKVSSPDDITIGNATIYTVLKNEEIEEFEINITKINETSDTKNITFEINDNRLLNKTGGIVQGMSGSPIMQNGAIIGVVTHVIVDNPTTGYGLFITKMLEEGEK